MTVVYKKTAPGIRSGDEVVVAIEKDSNRLLFHQRVNTQQKERNFSFPMVKTVLRFFWTTNRSHVIFFFFRKYF